jgi:CheY-like chemotaxis protein
VSLAGIVQQACATVDHLYRQKQQTLAISVPDEDVWFQGDGVRQIQVLENLLTNAAKYTQAGGQAQLSAAVRDEHVVLRVKDNGVGMDQAFLAEAFDLFTQAEHSIDRAQGGLGIGLTLVRNIVELHGGSVAVHSDGRGQGSEFTVRIPLVVATPPDAPPPAAGYTGKALRILVVDDNVAAATLLSTLLNHLQLGVVEVVHDGASCLTQAHAFRPHIILLDIGLPDLDGYTVAQQLRAQSEHDAVLLVALTGYGQAEDRKKSQAVGFDVHLVKPPSLDQLAALLSHAKLATLTSTTSSSD